MTTSPTPPDPIADEIDKILIGLAGKHGDPAYGPEARDAKAAIRKLSIDARKDELRQIIENHSSRTYHPLAPRHDNYIIDASYLDERLAQLDKENQ